MGLYLIRAMLVLVWEVTAKFIVSEKWCHVSDTLGVLNHTPVTPSSPPLCQIPPSRPSSFPRSKSTVSSSSTSPRWLMITHLVSMSRRWWARIWGPVQASFRNPWMVKFWLRCGLRPPLSYLVDYNCITTTIRNLAHASVGHPAKLEIIGMKKKF